jgi:tellurite resistance protein TehA-like permease
VNLAVVALGLWDGYAVMSPDRLRHETAEPILCAIILLLMPLFALGAVHYSVHRRKLERLARPSWSRNPLNWWHDPLQSLFVTTCYMAAMAVGSGIRRPVIGSAAFWTFEVYCCFAIGLLIGQVMIYRVYRTRITMPNP